MVDDESLARQRVIRYILQFDPDLQIETASSGLEAVEKIRSLRPHLIFLDIEMPGLNGFEVLQQFEERPFQIVFQTAYDQFAIRAFEEQAIDYLLKPFNAERLHKALANALQRKNNELRLRKLEERLGSQSNTGRYLKKLTITQGQRLRILGEDDIFCFISKDHYTHVCFGDGLEGICDLSLIKLMQRLDPAVFTQLHRNNLVKISAISSCGSSRQSGMWVELKNGMRLPVSRNHQSDVRLIFENEK